MKLNSTIEFELLLVITSFLRFKTIEKLISIISPVMLACENKTKQNNNNNNNNAILTHTQTNTFSQTS